MQLLRSVESMAHSSLTGLPHPVWPPQVLPDQRGGAHPCVPSLCAVAGRGSAREWRLGVSDAGLGVDAVRLLVWHLRQPALQLTGIDQTEGERPWLIGT